MDWRRKNLTYFTFDAEKNNCIVLSNFGPLKLILIAPCTSRPKPYLLPISVLESADIGGLTKDSMILFHQTRSISHGRITGKICVLPDSITDAVDILLLDILGLCFEKQDLGC